MQRGRGRPHGLRCAQLPAQRMWQRPEAASWWLQQHKHAALSRARAWAQDACPCKQQPPGPSCLSGPSAWSPFMCELPHVHARAGRTLADGLGCRAAHRVDRAPGTAPACVLCAVSQHGQALCSTPAYRLVYVMLQCYAQAGAGGQVTAHASRTASQCKWWQHPCLSACALATSNVSLEMQRAMQQRVWPRQ